MKRCWENKDGQITERCVLEVRRILREKWMSKVGFLLHVDDFFAEARERFLAATKSYHAVKLHI